MNKELLLKVADAIEYESELGFDMAHFRYDNKCKTTACIAGHAVFIHSKELFRNQRTGIEVAAIALLNLSLIQSGDLFFHSRVSRKEAAEVIRHLVKYDEVEWNPIKRKMRVWTNKFLCRYSDARERTQVRDNRHIIALKDNFDSPSIIGIEVIPAGGVVSHDIRVENISKPVVPVLDEVD